MRRYLYGADAADGFDTLLHKGVIGEAYNISSNDGATNIEIALRLLELHGIAANEFHHYLAWIPDRPFNDHDYRVDGAKLAADGWRQRVPLSVGLRHTVAWYEQNTVAWWPGVIDAVWVDGTTEREKKVRGRGGLYRALKEDKGSTGRTSVCC